LYAALLVAYVSVMKHMAEKPVEMPGDLPSASQAGKAGRPAGEGAAS
jgi:hypothetical protein